jgi:hypothetical protein
MSFKSAAVFLLMGTALVLPQAAGAVIIYGDMAGTTVVYKDVKEDSITDPGTPLFGAPSITGDTLEFNPTSFGASSSSGTPGFHEGTLSSEIHANTGFFIDGIRFTERGDFLLAGFGGVGTLSSVTADLFIDVIEIDGNPVSINLGPGPFSMVFTPSDGNYNLLDDGPGPLVTGDWEGLLTVSVAQELADLGYVGNATRVKISLDNEVNAISEVGTTAEIHKKDVDGLTITMIPEPSTVVLLVAGLLGLAGFRRPTD